MTMTALHPATLAMAEPHRIPLGSAGAELAG